MSWFQRKPSENQLERIVMYAAMLARGWERDTSLLATKHQIDEFLEVGYRDIKVKPDPEQKGFARAGVQALLVESAFINELLDYRLANGDEPLPLEFRDKMLAAVQKSVNDFMNSR